MSDDKQQASWSELLWGRNGLRSLALAGGIALHAVNVYIVATVLPSVVRDIGGLEYYAWNMTLFVVASILGSALSPKTIDAWGLRNSFLVGLAIFAAGTAACAAAPAMEWMLIGRTGQGFGGGLILGLSYSSIRILFEERLWPKAMSLLSSMWGVATLAGPAVGGIFAESDAWRWAFWTVIPLTLGLAALVATQISANATTRSATPVGVPIGQIGLMIIAVLVVSVASLSPNLAWNIVGIVAGVAISVAIGLMDNKASTRLLPKGGYSLNGNLGSLYACVSLLSVTMTAEIFIPYFLQAIQGFSPLMAGYFMVLLSIGWSTGSIAFAGRGVEFANWLLRIGPLLSAVSLAGLVIVQPIASVDYAVVVAWAIGILLFGVGLGIGITWPHMLTQVFRISPAGQENMASSAIITVQLYALAFGAALAGMVTNAAGFTDPGGLVGTQQASVALLAVLALAPAWAAWLMRPVVRSRMKAAA